MPPGHLSHRYRVADLLVDVGRRAVLRGASEIHLPKLSFELLQTLIEAAPNVVSNEQLTQAVWQGVVVSPETVTQRVKLLRDALGDDHGAPRYIAGLRGQGYRLIPVVTKESGTENATAPEALNSGERLTRPRVIGTVLGATTLAVALAYFAVDQFLISKHAEALQRTPAASEGTSHAGPAPVGEAVPAAATFDPPPRSIAVLPFVNMSRDASEEYFSDGLTEELTNSLARITELRVSARTSSFSFKGKDTDIATIARKLNVAAVLEGSVRRSGNMIRITAQLNDAVTGFHVWSQTYDRSLGDVLKLESEIAEAIADTLKVTLMGDVATKIQIGATHNAAAFDAYLRATKAYFEWHPEVAIAAYTDATALDPDYALAYAARSFATVAVAGLASTPSAVREDIEKAQTDARKAIALAPDLAEGHLALAAVYDTRLEFTIAGKEYERALALAPGSVRVLRDYGLHAGAMGHGDSGLVALRRAMALDPLDPEAHISLSVYLYVLRRAPEAIAVSKDAEVLKPGCCYEVFGLSYYQLGNFESARDSCERVTEENKFSLICLAITYDKLRRDTDAETMLTKLRAREGDPGAVDYSKIYAQWGNLPRALDWLETAARLRLPDLGYLKVEPLLDPLRNEPRFQAIERALKFPE